MRRHVFLSLVFCALVSSSIVLPTFATETRVGEALSPSAEDGEVALIEELAGVFARHAEGKRLVVLPMEQGDLPISPDALGTALNRVLSEAQKKSGAALSIQSLREQMTEVLQDAEARRGATGFRNVLSQSVRGEADLGLSVNAVLGDTGSVETMLSLHDLKSGALLDTTNFHALVIRDDNRANPKTAIDAALQRFWQDVPEVQRVTLGLLPTTMGETGQKNAATSYFDQLIAEGLSNAVNSTNQIIRQENRQGIDRLEDADNGSGFYVSGAIAPWDDKTAKVFLYLNKGQVSLKSRMLFLDIDGLPQKLKDLLRPSAPASAKGFDAFIRDLSGFRNASLHLTLADRQGNHSYEVCPTPSNPTGCDRLVFRLKAAEGGPFMCFVVGDDGTYSLLRPNPVFAAHNELTAGVPLSLPDGKLADGSPEIWYALGPPGTSLVLCAQYGPEQHLPIAELTSFDGGVLTPKDLAFAAQLVRDSDPAAVDWSIVSIDEPLEKWRGMAAR